MRLVFIPSLTDGSDPRRSSWRGSMLAQAIQNTGHASAAVVNSQVLIQSNSPDQSICASADIIILQANPHPSVLAAIQRWKSRDKTVLLDLGPEYFLPVGDHSQYEPSGFEPAGFHLHGSLDETVRWGLRLADAVILSSQRMVEDIRGLANGILIPEYIDLDRYLTLGKAPHEGITLGWKNNSFDAQGVIDSGLKTALEHLCQIRPEVRLDLFGGDPAVSRQFTLPHDILRYDPLAGPDDWPALLSGVDIGLAPLYGMCDERRGWGDVLEFMAMKIPWVASHGPAYYELRPYGWIIENTASTWERVLLDVIDHLPAYAEEAQADPYLFAISHGIEENIESILAAFSEVMGMSQAQRSQSETR